MTLFTVFISRECRRFIVFIERQEKPTFPGRRESMFPSHECLLGLNEEFSRYISLRIHDTFRSFKFQIKLRFVYLLRKLNV